MTKTIMISLIASIALALITIASLVSSTANPGYFVAALVLMGVYCAGQYKYSQNYR
ncbi:MAG: hypothetical protein IKN20_03850 [Firmicutes bacterium]|nr:hypothetical protein [Bacillota bacterium]